MNKDLHNIDDVFNSAYQEFEEDPSPEVWQKINEGLDKKVAESYKRRFIGWKRTAILLLLLLTGFVLYESGVLKQNSGTANKNNTVQKPTPTVESPGNNNASNNSDAVVLNGENPLIKQEQKDIPDINSTGLPVEKNQPGKKVLGQKNNSENKLSDFFAKKRPDKSNWNPEATLDLVFFEQTFLKGAGPYIFSTAVYMKIDQDVGKFKENVERIKNVFEKRFRKDSRRRIASCRFVTQPGIR